jgi:hypothetical protein
VNTMRLARCGVMNGSAQDAVAGKSHDRMLTRPALPERLRGVEGPRTLTPDPRDS